MHSGRSHPHTRSLLQKTRKRGYDHDVGLASRSQRQNCIVGNHRVLTEMGRRIDRGREACCLQSTCERHASETKTGRADQARLLNHSFVAHSRWSPQRPGRHRESKVGHHILAWAEISRSVRGECEEGSSRYMRRAAETFLY